MLIFLQSSELPILYEPEKEENLSVLIFVFLLIDNLEFNSLDDIIDDELIENTSHESDTSNTIGAIDIDDAYKFENIIKDWPKATMNQT